jgi:hypothetical protein
MTGLLGLIENTPFLNATLAMGRRLLPQKETKSKK